MSRPLPRPRALVTLTCAWGPLLEPRSAAVGPRCCLLFGCTGSRRACACWHACYAAATFLAPAATTTTLLAADLLRCPDGRLQPAFLTLCRASSFAIVAADDSGALKPVCCGFFLSDTGAVTVFHDAKPVVGDYLQAVSYLGQDAGTLSHTFRVTKVDAALDVVCLRRTAARDNPAHFTLSDKADYLEGAAVQRVGVGIGAVTSASEIGELEVGLSIHQTNVLIAGRRHFAYNDSPAMGDSGGAVLLLGGQVIGMHLAGWNYAPDTLSPDPEESAAAAVSAAGTKRLRSADRALAAGVDGTAASVARSYDLVVRKVCTGGWALLLPAAAVKTAIADAI